QFGEHAPDLRVADLVVGLVVEIDLVDGSAGGDDQQFFHHETPMGGHAGPPSMRPGARAGQGAMLIACARSARAAPASWRRTPAPPTARWRPARNRAATVPTRRSSPRD